MQQGSLGRHHGGGIIGQTSRDRGVIVIIIIIVIIKIIIISSWEASGSIWEASGGIWKHLEASGEASGGIWKHLEGSGEASGGIWKYLDAFRGICKYLVHCLTMLPTLPLGQPHRYYLQPPLLYSF